VKYLSVCSGIEAATVAWHHMGWQPVAFSEIEKFPAQVLAHHYPDVPNYGDMTKFMEWPNESIDLLVGGTPCQSFSVAGLRLGMADPRGNLALTYLGIADRYKPRWIVWENVPGVLSSNGGRDFGSYLGALAKLGYGFAYRVLDARFFGVAQRRRRVFVVGYLGDWRRAAAVLFESPSGRRDHSPSREKMQSIAPTVVSGPPFSRTQNARVEADALVARMVAFGEYVDDGTASAMKARDYKDATDLVAQPIAMRESGQGYWMEDDKAGTLRAEGENRPSRPSHVIAKPIAFGWQNSASQGDSVSEHITPTLDKSKTPAIKLQSMAVRRLTPVECERLQGFPDNFTAIPWRGKPASECPDGPRYKALGNSMAVPVMRWIGERIDEV
jgi:DNA (cytosine-5)-methyltransferase 1